MLNHPTLGPMFRRFALSRVADEGILFLDALAAIPRPLWNGTDSDFRAQSVTVSNLYVYFLAADAMKAVHISCGAREKLKVYMRARSHPPPPLSEIYGAVMREVFSDLKGNNLFYDFCSYNRTACAYVNDSAAVGLRKLIGVPGHLKVIREKLRHNNRALVQLRFAHMVDDPSVSNDSIVARFFAVGTTMPWNFIHPVYVTAILDGEWDCVFDDARDDCLRELVAIPSIAAYLKQCG